MKYYQKITLKPCDEIGLHFLWSKVYTQIHLALASYQRDHTSQPLGISFPEYQYKENGNTPGNLGKTIHLISDQESHLKQLDLPEWLRRLSDHITLSDTEAVPDDIEKHSSFTRYQPKNSAAKRRAFRHRVEKLGESEEQAYAYITGMTQARSLLPYIQMQSLSNQQRYNLFIKQTDVTESSSNGEFTTYGLSKNGATVPVF